MSRIFVLAPCLSPDPATSPRSSSDRQSLSTKLSNLILPPSSSSSSPIIIIFTRCPILLLLLLLCLYTPLLAQRTLEHDRGLVVGLDSLLPRPVLHFTLCPLPRSVSPRQEIPLSLSLTPKSKSEPNKSTQQQIRVPSVCVALCVYSPTSPSWPNSMFSRGSSRIHGNQSDPVVFPSG